MRRAILLGLVVAAGPAFGHDVYVDVGILRTNPTEGDPRAGAFLTSLTGTFDLTEQLSVWAGFGYVREFPTQSTNAKDEGSNVFAANAGLLAQLSDHFSVMASANYSPPVVTTSFSRYFLNRNTEPAAVKLNASSNSVSGMLLGSYLSGGTSNFEWAVDALAGATYFALSQKMWVLPGQDGEETVAEQKWTAFCSVPENFSSSWCPLLRGVVGKPLWQARLGVGFTAILFDTVDVGVEGSVYIYNDAHPERIGVFSVAMRGQQVDLGNGVAVQPYRFTVKPYLTWRFTRVTLKAAYQFGLFVNDETGVSLGTAHIASLKATYHLTRKVHLSLSVTGQASPTPDLAATSTTLFGDLNVMAGATLGLLVQF